MLLLKSSAKVLLWGLLFWGLLAAATIPLWPLESRDQPLSLGDNPHPLFVSEIQEAAYELGRRCPVLPRKRVILLGGSGARAFHPDSLAGVTAADEVLGMALDYSNFTQIRQVVADLKDCVGAQGMHETTFILIPSFMSFVANRLRYDGPYTVYETEKIRSRLFAGEPGQIRPLTGSGMLAAAIALWRPVLAMRALSFTLERKVSERVQKLRARLPGNAAAVDTRQAEYAWRIHILPEPDGATPWAPEQNAELLRLIAEIRGAGASLVLVEQPTQHWLRERSKAFTAAHEIFRDVSADQHIPYIDFSTAAADTEFQDALHANTDGAKIWSSRLAQALADLQQSAPAALGIAAQAAGH